MNEEHVETTDAPDDDAAIAAEVSELTQSPSDQQAERIKSALIAAKKGEKAAHKRIKELEPIAARVTEIDAHLTSVNPIINAVKNNPKLLADALRVANGTQPSRGSTDQPDDDAEALGAAEDMNFYLADGMTPDAARGRRFLDRMRRVSRGQAEDVVRPYAGVTISDRANTNLKEAINRTDDDGVPWATQESIREVAKDLGDQASLMADPRVVSLILRAAVGLDKEHGRTPKAAPEPLYFSPAGQRRQNAPAVSADDKRAFAAAGLTEDDVKRSMAKLEKAGGKAVVLGS